MNVDFYVHGVPEGQDFWGVDKDIEYIKSFYVTQDVKETVRFVVEILNGNVCFCTYLRYKNIIAENSRAGSYFGMSLRFEGQYCKDVANLYKLFDQVYERFIVGSIIERVGEKERFMMSRFKSKDSEIKNVQSIMIEQLDKSFVHDFVRIDNSFVAKSTNHIKTYNVADTNSEVFFSDLKTYSKIYVSSEYPTKDYRINNAKAMQEQAVSKVKTEAMSQIEKKEAEIEALKRSKEAEIEALKRSKEAEIEALNSSANKKISNLKGQIDELQTQLQNGQKRQQSSSSTNTRSSNDSDSIFNSINKILSQFSENINDNIGIYGEYLKKNAKKCWIFSILFAALMIISLCLQGYSVYSLLSTRSDNDYKSKYEQMSTEYNKLHVNNQKLQEEYNKNVEKIKHTNVKIEIDDYSGENPLSIDGTYTVRIKDGVDTSQYSWSVNGATIIGNKKKNKIEIKVTGEKVDISCSFNGLQLDKIKLTAKRKDK